MESNKKSLFVGLSIIGVLLVTYFVLNWQPERFVWSETYDTESEHEKIKKPYNISIIYNLLDGYNDSSFNILEDSLADNLPIVEGQSANYVYIGHIPHFEEPGLDRIFEFAEKGNTVFIAANSLPQNFINKLYNSECQYGYLNENIQIDDEGNYYVIDENGYKVLLEEDYNEEEEKSEDDFDYDPDSDSIDIVPKTISRWAGFENVMDTVVLVNYYHQDLQVDQPIIMKYGSKTNKVNYDWNYIDESTFCHNVVNYAKLSYIEDFKTNFVKIPYGEGSFLIHSTPIQFTDYQLVREEGLAAAEKAFTHLAEGDIYWDNIEYDWRSGYNFPSKNSNWTPLEYILSQPPLKWAWYLLLSTIGFYLFFRAKRKQQIVPVLETKENSSLEYIKTVGRLYFLQNDHKKLASQKMKLFLQHVRTHYTIPTHEISTEMKDRLASKAQVPIELVEEIFTRYKRLQREDTVSTSHLTNFHFAVEEFYKKSK